MTPLPFGMRKKLKAIERMYVASIPNFWQLTGISISSNDVPTPAHRFPPNSSIANMPMVYEIISSTRRCSIRFVGHWTTLCGGWVATNHVRSISFFSNNMRFQQPISPSQPNKWFITRPTKFGCLSIKKTYWKAEWSGPKTQNSLSIISISIFPHQDYIKIDWWCLTFCTTTTGNDRFILQAVAMTQASIFGWKTIYNSMVWSTNSYRSKPLLIRTIPTNQWVE